MNKIKNFKFIKKLQLVLFHQKIYIYTKLYYYFFFFYYRK